MNKILKDSEQEVKSSQMTLLAKRSLSSSKQQQSENDRVFCTQCGMNNHIVDKCYKLHNFPLVLIRTIGKRESSQQLIKFQANNSIHPFEICNQLPFFQEDCKKLLALIHSQLVDTNNINHQVANAISNPNPIQVYIFIIAFLHALWFLPQYLLIVGLQTLKPHITLFTYMICSLQLQTLYTPWSNFQMERHYACFSSWHRSNT